MKQVVVAAVVLAVMAVRAGEPSLLVKNLQLKKPQTLVVYGTSLTHGGAWVKMVGDELNKKFAASSNLLTVVNGAQSGQHSDWGRANLDARVLAHKPDTVIIEFAVNDAATRFNISIEKAKANLLEMIERIQKANAQTEIILMVMNPLTGEPLKRRTNLEGYYDMYRKVAKEKKFLLIDHYPAWDRILKSDAKRFANLVPDGCHPTAQGSKEIIAPGVLKVLLGQ